MLISPHINTTFLVTELLISDNSPSICFWIPLPPSVSVTASATDEAFILSVSEPFTSASLLLQIKADVVSDTSNMSGSVITFFTDFETMYTSAPTFPFSFLSGSCACTSKPISTGLN